MEDEKALKLQTEARYFRGVLSFPEIPRCSNYCIAISKYYYPNEDVKEDCRVLTYCPLPPIQSVSGRIRVELKNLTSWNHGCDVRGGTYVLTVFWKRYKRKGSEATLPPPKHYKFNLSPGAATTIRKYLAQADSFLYIPDDAGPSSPQEVTKDISKQSIDPVEVTSASNQSVVSSLRNIFSLLRRVH